MIRIVSLPPGEAPGSIRKAWIGLELPTVRGGFWSAWIPAQGVLSLRDVDAPSTYAVDGSTAIAILEKASPEAAAWWRRFVCDSDSAGYQFLFPSAVCERLADRPSDAPFQNTSILDFACTLGLFLGIIYALLGMASGIWLMIIGGILWLGFSIRTTLAGKTFVCPVNHIQPNSIRLAGVVIGLIGIVILSVGVVRAWGYDLAGPPVAEGTRVREEVEMTTRDVEIVAVKGEDTKKIRQTVEHSVAVDIEVLESPAKEKGKFKARHVFDYRTVTTAEGDEPGARETLLEPFHRQTLLLQRTGNTWSTELVNEKPTPEQEGELKRYPNPFDHIFPASRVHLGNSWKVDGTRLASLWGLQEAAKFEGVAKCTFEKVVQKGSERFAQVKASFDCNWSHTDQSKRKTELWIIASGTFLRSLDSYLDADVSLEGVFTHREQATVDGEKITATARGKLRLHATQFRKPS